jgi:hypothetical protein
MHSCAVAQPALLMTRSDFLATPVTTLRFGSSFQIGADRMRSDHRTPAVLGEHIAQRAARTTAPSCWRVWGGLARPIKRYPLTGCKLPHHGSRRNLPVELVTT